MATEISGRSHLMVLVKVNPNHKIYGERYTHTHIHIHTYTQEHWWKHNIFCSFTTSILAELNIWCFEHSGDISCSLLINPSHTDKSWAGRNTCMWICTLWIYSLSTLENTDEKIIFFVYSPQSFWQSSASGVLSTLVTYIYIYIYIYIHYIFEPYIMCPKAWVTMGPLTDW